MRQETPSTTRWCAITSSRPRVWSVGSSHTNCNITPARGYQPGGGGVEFALRGGVQVAGVDGEAVQQGVEVDAAAAAPMSRPVSVSRARRAS